jgi:hypothetical protein
LVQFTFPHLPKFTYFRQIGVIVMQYCQYQH